MCYIWHLLHLFGAYGWKMSVSYSLANDWLCSDGFYVGVPLLSMSNLSFDTSLNAISCNQVWGVLLAAVFLVNNFFIVILCYLLIRVFLCYWKVFTLNYQVPWGDCNFARQKIKVEHVPYRGLPEDTITSG